MYEFIFCFTLSTNIQTVLGKQAAEIEELYAMKLYAVFNGGVNKFREHI